MVECIPVLQEKKVGILGSMLGKHDNVVAYRTVDGGHPAPYPEMTDEQLYNYELAFGVRKKTFEKPPPAAPRQESESKREPVLEPQAPQAEKETAPPLDWSRPVRTITSKQAVEIITTRARHPVYTVHGYIGGSNVLTVFTADGRLSEKGARFLENAPAAQSLHLNIYRNPDPHGAEPWLITQHATRAEADHAASAQRIACVCIAL